MDASGAANLALREDIGRGLRESLTLPVASAYLQASAGVSRLGGPFARAEAGVRPIPSLAAFAFTEWNQKNPQAGVGARWEMKW